MKSVITICAKNYIGLSLILGQSISKYNKDINFYIFVADEMSEEDKKRLDVPSCVYFAKDVLPIEEQLWDEMSFKYNLTEFCTAIKPFCLEWIFNNTKSEKVIYFDPDILVYDSLDLIWNQLDSSSFFITPHIVTIETKFTGQIKEDALLLSGMYNLGFIALRKSSYSKQMLEWWKERLINKCYVDKLNSHFYDQKWIDFLPCFFPQQEVFVSRNLGLNMAPWNFYERKFVEHGGKRYVRNRIIQDTSEDTLVFVHYSGFNYKLLVKNTVEQGNIDDLKDYQDVKSLMNEYHDYLIANIETFLHYIDLNYSYSNFDNDIKITSYHRRLFKGLIDRGETVIKPFSTTTGSLFDRLKNCGLISKADNFDPVSVKRGVVHKQFGKQLYMLNFLSRLLIRLIGVSRYMKLLRAMKFYSRYEVQIHLIDKKYMKDNLY